LVFHQYILCFLVEEWKDVRECSLDENRCVEYLLEWERVTRDCLQLELEKVIAKSVEWKKGFADIPVEHLEEILHHCSNAFTKASNFIGREELVQRAMDVLSNGKQRRIPPLILENQVVIIVSLTKMKNYKYSGIFCRA
jgi:hypothetical protein